ncbi:hypothetical protein OG462_43660 [Streptomyces sp. NBC_01077]|uniref:hypothetical protein n=1 Tax=Streptomyces sp. NBC_01077 TaxID=2903746 RepID=UPI00386579DC|nr:hypothetical protein OG462_01345 [Streptomyces sp. NBC_01077]WSV44400.1 hypothetical protein OG462_43660 [Streptomyces sp. NBC_01077]
MSGPFQHLAGFAGGMGGVAEGVHRLVLLGEQVQADSGFVVLRPGFGSEGDSGEQAGLGLEAR